MRFVAKEKFPLMTISCASRLAETLPYEPCSSKEASTGVAQMLSGRKVAQTQLEIAVPPASQGLKYSESWFKGSTIRASNRWGQRLDERAVAAPVWQEKESVCYLS